MVCGSRAQGTLSRRIRDDTRRIWVFSWAGISERDRAAVSPLSSPHATFYQVISILLLREIFQKSKVTPHGRFNELNLSFGADCLFHMLAVQYSPGSCGCLWTCCALFIPLWSIFVTVEVSVTHTRNPICTSPPPKRRGGVLPYMMWTNTKFAFYVVWQLLRIQPPL